MSPPRAFSLWGTMFPGLRPPGYAMPLRGYLGGRDRQVRMRFNREAVKSLSRGRKPTEAIYTKLYYHIVFSTKNRQPFINESVEDELHKYIAGIIRNIDGSCIEINGA